MSPNDPLCSRVGLVGSPHPATAIVMAANTTPHYPDLLRQTRNVDGSRWMRASMANSAGSELDLSCGVSEETLGVAAENILPDLDRPFEVN